MEGEVIEGEMSEGDVKYVRNFTIQNLRRTLLMVAAIPEWLRLCTNSVYSNESL